MLKIILAGFAVVIVVFLIVVSMQPSHFRMQRSITMAAPASAAFDNVNDLHKWQTWSPWAKMDPNAKMAYEGPSSGTGAGYSWDGNSKVGAGRMTITDSRPNELVHFKLEFLKPFKATNIADFTFKSEGNQTVVTWGMEGDNNFMFKAVGLFMNCDKMVGPQFEQGLADLKSIAEASGKK